jgi:hypothetical protein
MATTLLPGSEFQINVNSGGNNGISGAQDLADIALLPDGRFVVAYQSDYFGSATDTDPIVAIFSEVGGTSLAYRDTYNAGALQKMPAVAPRLNGGLGVVFQNERHANNTVDANGPNITYVPVTATGGVLSPIAVADFNAGAGHDALQNPEIATLASGRQVVVFERIWTALTDHDVFLNVVNAAGTATQFSIASPLDVSSNASWQANPAVAAIGNGALVVYEDGSGTTTASANIRARFFDGNTNALGAAVTIADHAARLRTADVAAIDHYRWAITYGDQNDVWVKVLDSTTGVLSPEIQLDAVGGFALNPQVSGAPGAGFVVTWAEFNGADYDVKARLFDGRANAVGSEFIVTSLTDASQFTPVVAATDHHIFFAWTDFGARPTDTAPTGIRGRIFGVHDNDGNPLVDSLYYQAHNPDVLQAGVDPVAHFNIFGWHEGRDPSGFFDTSAYLNANPDARASGVNPLDHYDQIGWRAGRDPGPNFDTTIYLLRNPDVAAAGVDPLAHYLEFGIYEGRQAHTAVGQISGGGFEAEYYLFHNSDVAAAGVDPLLHFNIFGWHEGRNPNQLFDTAGYLSHNPDVAAAGINPLQHYHEFGWREGRDPSASFDTQGYLVNNPDVAAVNIDPLEHYLMFGIYEGRVAVNDGVWG